MTFPSRSMTQTCVSSIETSNPAKCSMAALLFTSESRYYRLSGSSRPLPDVQTCQGRRWACWLSAYSGARGGELCQLRGCDVPRQYRPALAYCAGCSAMPAVLLLLLDRL